MRTLCISLTLILTISFTSANEIPLELEETILLPNENTAWCMATLEDGEYGWAYSINRENEGVDLVWGDTQVQAIDSITLEYVWAFWENPQIKHIQCFPKSSEGFTIFTNVRWGWLELWGPSSTTFYSRSALYEVNSEEPDSSYLVTWEGTQWFNNGESGYGGYWYRHVTFSDRWLHTVSGDPTYFIALDDNHFGYDLFSSNDPLYNDTLLPLNGAIRHHKCYLAEEPVVVGLKNMSIQDSFACICAVNYFPNQATQLEYSISLDDTLTADIQYASSVYDQTFDRIITLSSYNPPDRVYATTSASPEPLWTHPDTYSHLTSAKVLSEESTEQFLAYDNEREVIDIFMPRSGERWGTISPPDGFDEIRIFGQASMSGPRVALRYGDLIHIYRFGDPILDAGDEHAALPHEYSLKAYPNPFNPTTTISFGIPFYGDTRLTVYDIQGREVQALSEEHRSPGSYDVTFDGSALASGIYFVHLSAGPISATKKLVLLK